MELAIKTDEYIKIPKGSFEAPFQNNIRGDIENIFFEIDEDSNILLKGVPVLDYNPGLDLFEVIDEEIINTIYETGQKDEITKILKKAGMSHLIRTSKIQDNDFRYIEQNVAGDCVLASVNNAISLLTGQFPGIHKLREEAISLREEKGENTDDITEKDSPLDNSDYVNLVKKYLNIKITQENIITFGNNFENQTNGIMKIYDKIEESKVVFLGLGQHATFVKKIGNKYYLFDSMINKGFEEYDDVNEIIEKIRLKTLNGNQSNFAFG